METITTLQHTSQEDLFMAWQAAFEGYERTWTAAGLQADLIRRGYDAALSFGAFDGDRLLGFVLNGVGTFQGWPAAYDTGTGALPEARGRGLTKRIFEAALPHLKGAGVQRYVLEVLQQNTTALRIYQSLGFGISRELAYFIDQPKTLELREQDWSSDIHIATVPLTSLNGVAAMWDVQPSWQNTFESIARRPDAFVAVAAFVGGQIIGYGILEPLSGDLPQLAVAPAFRRRGAGTAILNRLTRLNETAALRIINVDTTGHSLIRFLNRHGLEEKGRQYEMILELG